MLPASASTRTPNMRSGGFGLVSGTGPDVSAAWPLSIYRADATPVREADETLYHVKRHGGRGVAIAAGPATTWSISRPGTPDD